MVVLDEFGSACLSAILKVPKTRPGGQRVDRFKTIEWKDATEEQREKLLWIEHGAGGLKTAHIPLTPQEKEEIKLNEQYHKEQVYKYLLKHYGIEYANTYAMKNNILINESIPHCVYTKDKQCNLFCDFFKEGECKYEDRY